MIESTAAKAYAQALFNVAGGNKREEAWGAKLKLIEGIIKKSRDLRIFFLAPAVSPGDKVDVLKRLSDLAELPEELTKFIALMIKKRGTAVFAEVVREYFNLLDFFLGQINVLVRSAVELSGDEKENLGRVLGTKLGKKARFKYRVEPDLIGGVVVRAGEKVYDGSIVEQLDMMKRRMLEG